MNDVDLDVGVIDELLSQLAPAAPLTTGQVARIRSRIDERKPSRRNFVAVGAVALALVGSAVVLAMHAMGWIDRDASLTAPAIFELPDASSQSAPLPERTTVNELMPPEPGPVVIPPPKLLLKAPPGAHLAPQPTVPRLAIDDPEGALGAESRMLGLALRELRNQRDPRASLVTLDRYAAEFPQGALAREARAARVEALLAVGNNRGALVLLDETDVGTELAVLRGELRLDSGRVADAAKDFDMALLGKHDAIEQRALYGRAACRVKLGDRRGARRDLEDYLRRFSTGKFASVARAALDAIDAQDGSR